MNIEKRKVWARRGENNKCKAGKKVLIFLKHSVNFILQYLFSPIFLFLPHPKKKSFFYFISIFFLFYLLIHLFLPAAKNPRILPYLTP